MRIILAVKILLFICLFPGAGCSRADLSASRHPLASAQTGDNHQAVESEAKQDPSDESEAVDAPVPITGSYLTCLPTEAADTLSASVGCKVWERGVEAGSLDGTYICREKKRPFFHLVSLTTTFELS